MKSALKLSVIAVGATLIAAGCADSDDRTVGQKIDSAVATTETTASAVAKDAQNAVQTATTAVGDATASAAAVLDDAAITASINASLAKDSELSALKIDVDTKSGMVTLYGSAPNDAAKDRATTIANGIQGVVSVSNQLSIKK